MQVTQIIVRKPEKLAALGKQLAAAAPKLLLVFAGLDYFTHPGFAATLAAAAPGAALLGCSTAGEISPEGVDDGSCVVTAIDLAHTSLRQAATALAGMDDSFAAGVRLGQQLATPDLKAILVFGPGVQINGSALVSGIASVVGDAVPITGGLAGDAGAFQQTWTLGQNGVSDNGVVAVGLCGDRLNFAHGSFGGWEPFGPARKVTRCSGNVLHELDGEPALEVYKRYLGEHAKGLPASGLLFPFAMLGEDHNAIGLIRTILGVDESTGSLTLAGEIQQDGYLKLMHASTDKLVNGAECAAEAANQMLQAQQAGLAILVSCVGRKLVMGGRVDEEVEAVADVFGSNAVLTGFYSYGEISPFTPGASCKLHNQTMTITYLGER
ncbi:FIST N-terminal domain-containing protein [Dechloromonas sp. ZY10]|uniref:FIST signal transduction protein n=1 Tax=Dechloromonas aquae TaxID=2664436 RepID=UPI003528AFA5